MANDKPLKYQDGTLVMSNIQGVDSSGDRKNIAVDSDGNLQVDVLSTSGVVVTNAIDSTAYDLNAAAFSETTSITNDYILDNIEFNFSTAESKTITVTTADGTQIYTDTNTAQHVELSDINQAYNTGENITVDVTQFSSAGTMDCVLKVRQGTSVLSGSPELAAGDNVIGRVKITDGTDVCDVTSDGELEVVDSSLLSTSVTEGSLKQINIVDNEARSLLNSLLKQIKIMNMHLSVMTDNVFETSDVEV